MSETARLTARDCGNPSGPPLLLVHGFMSCNAQWLANEAELGAVFRLIMVELWGHGRSPVPDADSGYTAEAYVAEFERIRRDLGIERWQAVGQSYGAGLILNYAVAYPERCTAVVITNSRSALGSLAPRSNPGKGAPNPMSEPDFDRRSIPVHPIHARRFPEDIKTAMVESADAMDRDCIRKSARLSSQLSFRETLDVVPVPMLIANGVYEKTFQTDITYLRNTYSGVEIVDLEGGHSVNVEAANEFNRVTMEFLSNPVGRVERN